MDILFLFLREEIDTEYLAGDLLSNMLPDPSLFYLRTIPSRFTVTGLFETRLFSK